MTEKTVTLTLKVKIPVADDVEPVKGKAGNIVARMSVVKMLAFLTKRLTQTDTLGNKKLYQELLDEYFKIRLMKAVGIDQCPITSQQAKNLSGDKE